MKIVSAMVVGLTLLFAQPSIHAAENNPAGWFSKSTRGVEFWASDLSGRVVFNDLAVPGATITAKHGDRVVSTVSDDEGAFHFAVLDDGVWTIRVEMRGFVPASRDVTLPASPPPLSVTLTLRRYEDMTTELVHAPASAPSTPEAASKPSTATGKVPSKAAAPSNPAIVPPPDDAPEIINGSSINGAASVFAQARAFGNSRPGQGVLYSGAVTSALGNSAWNATPFSFGGSAAPSPSYGDVQLGLTLGGPLRIPWLVKNGPQMLFSYTHGVNHTATTQSAVMPTSAQRSGDFSGLPVALRDPLTGLPFAGNVIPSNRISPQAAALLAYYPLPNGTTSSGANYQRPVLSSTTSDNLQFGMNKNVTRRTTIGGTFSLQRSTTSLVNLFDFTDASRDASLNAGFNWSRRMSTRLLIRARYQFTRATSDATPFFSNRVNVSGDAGITGNNQDPLNWGPPALSFSDIAGLRDADYRHSSNLAHAGNVEAQLKRGRHNITMGGDASWKGFSVTSQPNPRGTLTFTGAMTGSGFGDFLLGLPGASSLAFGSTGVRLRAGAYDAYLNDDFRLGAGLTLNVGVRWEYEAPATEVGGRLANLDVASGFSAIAPVTAANPVGPLTGSTYSSSLLRSDKRSFEPRIATSWRPILGSSLVIRASYGLYRNLGVYEPIALLLAQQPPFSRTFSVQNSALTPLTLATPFPTTLPTVSNTFGIDPKLSPGYAHTWQVQVQRDLPASLTFLAVYDGARGTHLMQAFLPNTYPVGAVNPCPTCPSGFVYVTSNGTSLRNSGQFTLRRRLHNGLTASIQYTIAKSTDDAATFSNSSVAPGALAIAQDWLNLGAERGPSSFDQRHLVTAQVQYTTGVGVAGGTLVDSRWGTLFKDWTITSQMSSGSGLPLTPISFSTVAGTGIVGVRPMLTGESLAPTTAGSYVNPAAFTTPLLGTWGNAGRNSIRGPRQFSLDASIARVFRLKGRLNLEWRVAATNVLNHVTYSTIGTVISSPQFGLPTAANQMRRIQMTARFRF